MHLKFLASDRMKSNLKRCVENKHKDFLLNSRRLLSENYITLNLSLEFHKKEIIYKNILGLYLDFRSIAICKSPHRTGEIFILLARKQAS